MPTDNNDDLKQAVLDAFDVESIEPGKFGGPGAHLVLDRFADVLAEMVKTYGPDAVKAGIGKLADAIPY